jgi:hypothetical protein
MPTPSTVERVLSLPPYRHQYDQNGYNACVGFGTQWAMSIMHLTAKNGHQRFDPLWLWNQAKAVDEWDDTNPGDNEGTSVRAAFDVLRAQGDMRFFRSKDYGPDLANGVKRNEWATNVDLIRASIAAGMPVVIGVNWYSAFDEPEKVGNEYWIGRSSLGQIEGGHCVCIYGASDKRQAFKVVNNWGITYPLVWLPYKTEQRLMNEDGEAAVITA